MLGVVSHQGTAQSTPKDVLNTGEYDAILHKGLEEKRTSSKNLKGLKCVQRLRDVEVEATPEPTLRVQRPSGSPARQRGSQLSLQDLRSVEGAANAGVTSATAAHGSSSRNC